MTKESTTASLWNQLCRLETVRKLYPFQLLFSNVYSKMIALGSRCTLKANDLSDKSARAPWFPSNICPQFPILQLNDLQYLSCLQTAKVLPQTGTEAKACIFSISRNNKTSASRGTSFLDLDIYVPKVSSARQFNLHGRQQSARELTSSSIQTVRIAGNLGFRV